MSNFKYEVVIWRLPESAEAMRLEIQKRYNSGWQPTTNGPAMALMTRNKPDDEEMHFMVMYIFAKEKTHDHN